MTISVYLKLLIIREEKSGFKLLKYKIYALLSLIAWKMMYFYIHTIR